VPTPIDEARRPDLGPLIEASKTVGQSLQAGNVVIYESTVYPGCTELDCAPILARESGLVCLHETQDEAGASPAGFYLGYSPERINPGDRTHRLPNIIKITAGSTPAAASFVDALYSSIVPAGTHRASSIAVAEAAKVIENAQRDVNIGLINELSMLFSKLGLDTAEILAAASTKWNFLPFRPGLVGGHCLGVDPYYLTHRAQQVGFHPEMILAGRRTNDNMGHWVAGEIVQLLARKQQYQAQAKVLVLGLTFKENCPDLRNTLVIDLVQSLQRFQLSIDIHDPWVDATEAKAMYDLNLCEQPQPGAYHAVVLAVAHQQFNADYIVQFKRPDGVIYDLKHVLPQDQVDGRL
ncbi:MAG: nucleotide sugar dehydrogenase, partial [Pseudomonadota bacterium]